MLCGGRGSNLLYLSSLCCWFDYFRLYFVDIVCIGCCMWFEVSYVVVYCNVIVFLYVSFVIPIYLYLTNLIYVKKKNNNGNAKRTVQAKNKSGKKMKK